MFSPPARLLAAALLSLAMAALSGFWASLAALAMGAAALAAGRIPWHVLRPRLTAVNVFLLFMWLVIPFTSPGQWGQISTAGIRLCLLISLKANAIAAIFTAFLSPMSPYNLGAALSGLRFPDKLVWLFLLLDRNVSLMRREWLSLHDAARLRGFVPRASIHTYRTLGGLAAQWLYRAWLKAARLQEALLLRGYDGAVHFAAGSSYRSWPQLLLPLFLLMLLLLYLNYALP